MDEADIEAILSAYREDGDAGKDEAVPARLVPHAEIEDNGWDLNIGRYLKASTAETIDVATALATLRGAQAKLREAEAKLDEKLKAAGYA